jgi:hypothetical protein
MGKRRTFTTEEKKELWKSTISGAKDVFVAVANNRPLSLATLAILTIPLEDLHIGAQKATALGGVIEFASPMASIRETLLLAVGASAAAEVVQTLPVG